MTRFAFLFGLHGEIVIPECFYRESAFKTPVLVQALCWFRLVA